MYFLTFNFYALWNIFLDFTEILKSRTKGLIHHWSFDKSLKDLVTRTSITLSGNTKFTENRLGEHSKAIYFDGGYATVPTSNYFGSTELTITTWVRIFGLNQWSRIFDFGNGQGIDNFIFGIVNQKFVLNNRGASFISKFMFSSKDITLNDWYFLSITFKDLVVKMYMNGELTSTDTLSSLYNTNTNLNYFGKSNWASDPLLNGVISSMKIFNRELSQNEILMEMEPIQEIKT